MNRLKKTGIWLAFILCFVGIPALLLFFGLTHLEHQDSQARLEANRIELSRFYQNMRKFADPEYFWCITLMEMLAPDTIPAGEAGKVIIERTRALRKNLSFNFIVYNPANGVMASSQRLEPLEDWRLALTMAWKIIPSHAPPSVLAKENPNLARKIAMRIPHNAPVTREEELAGGRIFGPQLYWAHFEGNTRIEQLNLTIADSRLKNPLIWGRKVHNHLILVFIDHKDLEGKEGIWNLLNDFSRKSDGAVCFSLQSADGSFRHDPSTGHLARQIAEAAAIYDREKTQQIQTADLQVFPFFLRPGTTVFGYLQRGRINGRLPFGVVPILALLFSLAAFWLTRYSWLLIFREQPDDVSLRWKLRFLFFFANGLPLLVLFFIGNDYLTQKRSNLLLETQSKAISFIQDFDEKIEVEYARRLAGKEKAQKKMIERLADKQESDQVMSEFITDLGSSTWRIVMVASRSSTIVTEKGLYDEKRGIFPDQDEKSDRNRNQNEFTMRVGQFFLDKINGVKVSEKVETELEFFIESTTQKPLANFLFELLQKRGSFVQWGFGQNVNPAIFDTFSLKDSSQQDIFFLSSFRVLEFQHRFLQTALPQANRNNLGLKIVAILDQYLTEPPDAYNNVSLRDFASTLTSYPTKEIKILEYDGQPHLAMGIAGRHIKEYRLVGLFPLENIESVIRSQRRLLLIFALLSLLMTWGLSQVLAQSFISPLQQITAGAVAIENKHFSHRLPDLGRDEFGAMGRVFNAVMVDLEELSVASAIQEQLLPQQQIETGNFSLYGRSISMGELGGDYFDHIGLEDNKFSVLLGDVAGHGVGAALIMAMAKAGIIQSEHLLDQPMQLLNRLHSLIYASKTKKQKKIMTFQYLHLDGNNGRGRYSNAGACSPMIVRKSREQVEELTLTGAALGAFKKPNYSEIEVIFAPGDAIVFYTDGIVEARNPAGEELGYDRLRHLFLETWHADAETFYGNIHRAYLNHIGTAGAQDDLTMVILVYNPKEGAPADV